MKTGYIYTSNNGMKFTNVLSCALDNQTDKTKFIELWMFIADFDHDALWQWLSYRNFHKNLPLVVDTLVSIGKLS